MTGKHAGSLELQDDLAYARRQWRIERIGWLVMMALILAAVGGLFGGAGLFLKHRQPLTADGGTSVEYPRFGRFMSPLTLRFRSNEAGALSTLRIGEDYLNAMTVLAITPPPAGVMAEDGMLVYSFRGDPRQVTFSLSADVAGLHRLTVAGTGEAPVTFRQFIYP